MASEQELSTSFIPALYKPAALLPIARHKKSLLYLVENFPVTIVVGQTGSGKTTQLPQYLEQAGWCGEGKTIAVTQVSAGRCFMTIALLTQLSPEGSPPPRLQRE